jgi:uncharacterized repeat protein (TIGR01451 family)
MKNIIVIALTAGLLSLSSFVSAVSADTSNGVSCQPIYGGGETCVQVGNIVINKTVKNPSTGAFVDNLNVNDPKYSPTSTATFQITVTNTGGGTIAKTTVKDTLPNFVTFVSGPGSFDSNSKVLTFEVNNLGAGQSQTFTVTAKIADAGSLSQSVTCIVNQVTATAEKNQSSDNSQFCIEKGAQPTPTQVPGEPVSKGGKKVFPAPEVKTTPPTGPEMFSLVGLIPAGAVGMFLRKKASK